MRARHPRIPAIWLMTDERIGDALWTALGRLPRGSGVVFRHYGLSAAERRALFARVARVAARRGLVLVRAGGAAGRDGAGTHNGARPVRPGIRTFSAHSRREAVAAIRRGADALFVSPVHPTRSHPGARTLGPVRLGLMTRGLNVPVIALGGMDARKARALRLPGIHGWAGIDAWSGDRDQKRKAVPT